MEIRLSSRWTPVYRRWIPLMTVGGMLVGTAMVFKDPYGPHVHVPGGTAPYAWMMSLSITALVGVIMWWMLMRLVELRLDDDTLVIETSDDEVRIPLSQVSEIRGPLLGDPKRYVIKFDDETPVGHSVMFLSPRKWSINPFADPDAVVELRVRWAAARAAR